MPEAGEAATAVAISAPAPPLRIHPPRRSAVALRCTRAWR